MIRNITSFKNQISDWGIANKKELALAALITALALTMMGIGLTSAGGIGVSAINHPLFPANLSGDMVVNEIGKAFSASSFNTSQLSQFQIMLGAGAGALSVGVIATAILGWKGIKNKWFIQTGENKEKMFRIALTVMIALAALGLSAAIAGGVGSQLMRSHIGSLNAQLDNTYLFDSHGIVSLAYYKSIAPGLAQNGLSELQALQNVGITMAVLSSLNLAALLYYHKRMKNDASSL